MIHEPEILYGIDMPINDIQKILENIILKKGKGILGEKWDECNIYGRIYKNLRNGIYIPEIYISNGEYREIFIDDREHAEIGFYVKNDTVNYNHITSDIDVIVTVNYEKMKKYYNIEYLKTIMLKWLYETRMLEIGRIKNGVDEVFAEFDRDRYKYRDIYPFGIISIETQLTYSTSLCV